MKKIYTTLSTLGFSDKEATVYLAALKNKRTGPSTLAKSVGMPRSTVYDTMLSLVLKGFVTLREGKKGEQPQTWIEPKSAKQVHEMIASQQKERTQALADLIKMLSSVENK